MEQLRIIDPYPVWDVVILGMGLTAHEWAVDLYQTPHLRSDCEVWTVNWGGLYFDHDRLFNLHNFRDDEYWANAKRVYAGYKREIVTCLARDDDPRQRSYPVQRVMERFNTTYLENGVASIIAFYLLCMEEARKANPKEAPKRTPVLRLYGCDYNYQLDHMQNIYENGRACVEYWLGIAHNLGVNVGTAKTSMLMDTKKRIQHGMYGWGKNQPEIDVEIDGNREIVKFLGIADDPPLTMDEASKAIDGGDAETENGDVG